MFFKCILLCSVITQLCHSFPQVQLYPMWYLNTPAQENYYPIRHTSALVEPVKVSYLPFYGGAKGQVLQVTENADGTIQTMVIDKPNIVDSNNQELSIPDVEHVEHPELPNRNDRNSRRNINQSPKTNYERNLSAIQNSALNILNLQETAKRAGGRLSSDEEETYKRYMQTISDSADSITQIFSKDLQDDNVHNRAAEGLSAWFARKKNSSSSAKKKEEEEKRKKEEEAKRKKEEEERKKKKEEEDRKRKKEEEDKKKKEEEDRKKKEEEEKKKIENENEDDDTIAVDLPSDEASVAEAKPIGLAVAGIGGVASSKPVATAVVGPGGLAIARPVGTAIAGVSPDQALVPIYAEGIVSPGKKDEKKQIHSTEYISKIISKYHQT